MRRTLGWLGEKLGHFRYPPYDEKAIHTIRNIIKNRYLYYVFDFVINLSFFRAFPSIGWMAYMIVLLVGAGLGAIITCFIIKYRNKGVSSIAG